MLAARASLGPCRLRSVAEWRVVDCQQQRSREALRLYPAKLSFQEFQLKVCTAFHLPFSLDSTPVSSSALLKSPMMRTKGASSVK